MSSDGQERTEDPTDRRRKEARKKGTVTKSQDLVGASVFMALLMTLPGVLIGGFNGFKVGLQRSMDTVTMDISMASVTRTALSIAQPALPSLYILIAVAMTVGVLGNVAQVGFHVGVEAIKPSFNKINPANGIKRLFSKNSVFEAGKGSFKLVLFSLLTYTTVIADWPKLGMIWSLTPVAALSAIGGITKSIALKVGGAWLALAAVDYIFQRKQIEKQLKMTKDEVRQEMKDAESSPEVKAAMARRRRQLGKRKTAQAVREADVIITNPTHFAVAISYKAGKDFAPTVVAKGVDSLALKIREIAKESKVPIVENRALARALHKQCEIGDHVPRELFQPVAEVLAFVYRTVKKIRKTS